MSLLDDKSMFETPVSGFRPGQVLEGLEYGPVAVGDLQSEEKGSGARMNSGKPAFDLIPVRAWAHVFEEADPNRKHVELINTVWRLAYFQEHTMTAEQLLRGIPAQWWEYCAHVFDYGRKKYSAWNWLKGMVWSVPIGCILRHAFAVIIKGEHDDPESGLPHYGHIMCNIVMLFMYERGYPAGDDRPKAEYFNG